MPAHCVETGLLSRSDQRRSIRDLVRGISTFNVDLSVSCHLDLLNESFAQTPKPVREVASSQILLAMLNSSGKTQQVMAQDAHPLFIDLERTPVNAVLLTGGWHPPTTSEQIKKALLLLFRHWSTYPASPLRTSLLRGRYSYSGLTTEYGTGIELKEWKKAEDVMSK
jgi:hypothetical protein